MNRQFRAPHLRDAAPAVPAARAALARAALPAALALTATALFVPAAAQQADDSPPLYQVEVIVFAYNDADPNEELFRPQRTAAPVANLPPVSGASATGRSRSPADARTGGARPGAAPAERQPVRPGQLEDAQPLPGSADSPVQALDPALDIFDFAPLTAPDLADRIETAIAEAAAETTAAGVDTTGAETDGGTDAGAGTEGGAGPNTGPAGAGSGIQGDGATPGADGSAAGEPSLADSDAGAAVNDSDAIFGASTGSNDAFRFRVVERNALQLHGVYDRLQRIDAYTPLLHGGWIQEGLPEARARPFDLAYLGTFNPLGTIRLHVSRFLHLTLDLDYRPTTLQPAARLPQSGSTAAPNVSSPFGLSEVSVNARLPLETGRRIRSGEVHYFDHPYFGVLVMVTPYEPEPDAAQGPAA